MNDRLSLIERLQNYNTPHPEELAFISRFLELLDHPRSFHRDHLPGHLTGSAWIIDSTASAVLLVHHAKLNRWLQPGGHADGDENILHVALKEAEEETGLRNLKILESLFDIDIHTIPQRKDFPAHDHYDVRCLLQGDQRDQLIISDESTDMAWIPLEMISAKCDNSRSITRMIEKTKVYLELISNNANEITTSQKR